MTREEAIKIISQMIKDEEGFLSDNTVEAHKMAIKALEQEPKWIPVTKRQPKKSGKYWCTFGGTNLTGTDYYTTESDAKELFDDPEEYAGWNSQNVVAWMPLPSSYREVEE